MGKREAMRVRTLVRSVAVLSAALLVLIGFQTAISLNEVNPPTTLTVPADEDSLAASVLIHAGTLGLDEPEETALVSLHMSISSEENEVTVILELSMDGDRATATFRVHSGMTECNAYDALGNVRVVIDSSGARVNTLAYRPFGICAYGCSGEPKYGYTGEYREATPNLIYLGSRWNDPTIGRFISPDDRLGSLSDPQDQNRYAYFLNNPMKYTDPTGHDWMG